MAHKPYMPLYIAEYMADTAHLTMAEHGAYLLLIMTYWQTEKPLPDDDKKLAMICRTTLKGFRQIKSTVSLLFTHRGNTLVHKRVEEELYKFREKSELSRVAAEKRWEGKGKNSDADAMRTHSGRIADAMRTQCHTEADTDTDIHNSSSFSGVTRDLKTVELVETTGAERKNRSAQMSPPDDSPVFIFIPLRGGEEYGFTENMLREFERAYPSLNVRGKLQKIRTWSLANSQKQKTRRGILRFINSWLARDNDQLSDGLTSRKLSAVEHNQLLLERRKEKYLEEEKSLKMLEHRGKNNAAV